MTASAPPERRAVLRRTLALLLLYGVAVLLGGSVFLLILRGASAALGPGVLFYRGVGALCGVFLLLMVILFPILSRLPRRLGLDAADSPGAAIVSTSLLLAAFVVGPVTVDRSISVFMLSQFDAAGRPLTATEARDAFVDVYVDDWAQIDRRLKEQALSGNLEQGPGGWRLTPQGRAFVNTARLVSRLFGGDPRFVGRTD
jgi:hypothetical protein